MTKARSIALESVKPYCPECGNSVNRPEGLSAAVAGAERAVDVECVVCGAIVLAQFWRSLSQSVSW